MYNESDGQAWRTAGRARCSSYESGKLRGELALQRPRFGGIHNALRLAALLVDVHARQPERVGPRAAPVDVLQVGTLAVGAFFQRQVAVLQQPGVQIDTAFERSEAVIGEHEQHRLGVHVAPSPGPPVRRRGSRDLQ